MQSKAPKKPNGKQFSMNRSYGTKMKKIDNLGILTV